MSNTSVIKAVDEQRFLLCVAYSPHRMPLRGVDKKVDVVSPEVLEKACWRFAQNGFRTGLNHRAGGEGAFRIVESAIHRGPTWEIQHPDGSVTKVRDGDWVVGLICTPSTWADYKAGKFSGVSFQGSARRKPASASTLAAIKER